MFHILCDVTPLNVTILYTNKRERERERERERKCDRSECYNVPRCVGRNCDVSGDIASQPTACAAIRCCASQLQLLASSAGPLAKNGRKKKQMKVRIQIENDVKN